MTHPPQDTAMPGAEELAELIRRIAAEGDRQSFARIYRHFAPRIAAFLRKGGLPSNTAEEIAQEAMIAVWRKASYFDPARAGPATWIFTIARNLHIDHMRRARVAQAAEGGAADPGEAEPSGEALLLASEREARVRAALTALTEEQAAVVRLSFFNDRPHAEIARELGIPLGTVKSRVRLALGRLRALLEGEA